MLGAEPRVSPNDLATYYRRSGRPVRKQEHRSGGRFGVNAIAIATDPYERQAPGFDEWIFAFCRSEVRRSYLDIGNGKKTFQNSSAGTLSAIPANTSVSAYSSSSVDLTFISVPSEKLREVFPDVGNLDARIEEKLGIPSHIPGAAHVVETIWAACDENCNSSSLLVDAKVMELFALFTNNTEVPAGRQTVSKRDFAQVLEYIDTSLADAISVAELAEQASMSPTHFSRLFKQTHGESVWRYIKNRRCERAREMLQFTTEPLAQIAYACGFSSQAHFSRVFKHRFGVTPGSVRRE